jgi:Pyridoxal-phosphate dependent enzyme
MELSRVWSGPGRILAKAEFMQPGGSVKDRAARAIIEAARANGRLKPGAPVVEMTSGNMGAGLAVVCAALGHPLVVTMSAGDSRLQGALPRADIPASVGRGALTCVGYLEVQRLASKRAIKERLLALCGLFADSVAHLAEEKVDLEPLFFDMPEQRFGKRAVLA